MKSSFQIGDIISYLQMCSEEGVNLQKGMNYNLGGNYSVILMSLRENAPYADRIEEGGKVLIYEGHDWPRYKHKGPTFDPKSVDQPMNNDNGTPFENGKFYNEAVMYKDFDSNSGGSSNVSSSADSELFGMGLLTNGAATQFRVKTIATQSFSDNSSNTAPTAASNTFTTQSSFESSISSFGTSTTCDFPLCSM